LLLLLQPAWACTSPVAINHNSSSSSNNSSSSDRSIDRENLLENHGNGPIDRMAAAAAAFISNKYYKYYKTWLSVIGYCCNK
jgi:hypothetical protein